MKHSSDYGSDEWLNARDRRHSRRKDGADEPDHNLEKISA
jgi:mannose-1-phosphate guanylyltransferase